MGSFTTAMVEELVVGDALIGMIARLVKHEVPWS
jgi:hypothetical protein